MLRLRTGDYPNSGRLAVDLPAGTDAELVGIDNRLVLRVSGGTLARTDPPPHNVRSIALVPEGADLVLAPGAHLRHTHLLDKLVIEVTDPVAPAPVGTVTQTPVAAPTSQPSNGVAQGTASAAPAADVHASGATVGGGTQDAGAAMR